MFRDAGAAGGGHKTGECGDIERGQTVTTRPTRVDKTLSRKGEGRGLFTERTREAKDLPLVLPANAKRSQEASGLGGRHVTGHEGERRLARVALGEGSLDRFVKDG